MLGLAVVAGAEHGDFGRAETEALHAACLDKGQCLKGFERGTGEGDKVCIAGLRQHLAACVGDGDRAEMGAFGIAAARQFNQGDQVVHRHMRSGRRVGGAFPRESPEHSPRKTLAE